MQGAVAAGFGALGFKETAGGVADRSKPLRQLVGLLMEEYTSNLLLRNIVLHRFINPGYAEKRTKTRCT